MKCKIMALGLFVCGLAPCVLAQGSPSVAELARQHRENRLKMMQAHSVRVWNNDNIPRQPAGRGPTAAAGMSAAPIAPEPASSLESASPGSAVHDEAYFRTEMKKLRERLELHQRQLAVLQQKAAQGQLQYFPDPNKTLQEEFSRSEINKRNDEIAEKQKEIAEDEKAIQDLQDLLRREGHPPGWLR
jgi:hypothetical protein